MNVEITSNESVNVLIKSRIYLSNFYRIKLLTSILLRDFRRNPGDILKRKEYF